MPNRRCRRATCPTAEARTRCSDEETAGLRRFFLSGTTIPPPRRVCAGSAIAASHVIHLLRSVPRCVPWQSRIRSSTPRQRTFVRRWTPDACCRRCNARSWRSTKIGTSRKRTTPLALRLRFATLRTSGAGDCMPSPKETGEARASPVPSRLHDVLVARLTCAPPRWHRVRRGIPTTHPSSASDRNRPGRGPRCRAAAGHAACR